MKPGINNEQIKTQKVKLVLKTVFYESGNILQSFLITASDGSCASRKKLLGKRALCSRKNRHGIS